VLGVPGEFAARGSPLTEADIKLLDSVAKFADVDADIVFAIEDVALAGKPDAVSMAKIREERPRVLAAIEAAKPELVVCFGPVAVKTIFNKGNKVLSEMLRTAHTVPDVPAPVYVTHSLEHAAAKPGVCQWLRFDVHAAVNGLVNTQWGDYTVLLPGTQPWDVCPPHLNPTPAVVGLDLETYPGLSPWDKNARIRMAVISDRPGLAVIVQATPDSRFPPWLVRIIEDPNVVKAGSNIKFDYRWLARFGVVMRNMHDTSTGQHLIDETDPFKDLKSLTFRYLPRLGDYSREHRALVAQRGGWEHVEDKEMYTYCGGDGEASVAAAVQQREIHARRGLEVPFRLSMDLYAVLARMEEDGCKIDMEENGRLDVRFKEQLEELRGKICEVLGPINLASPDQLATALVEAVPNLDLRKYQLKRQLSGTKYQAGKHEAGTDLDEVFSTEKAILEREASKHPVIDQVLLWRRFAKLHGTYVEGIVGKLAEHGDGQYLHTSYRTDVVETCRLSSQGPNLQNVPRKPEPDDKHPIPPDLNIKRQYVSRFPGGGIMEGDLSQAEIRLAAMISQDQAMLGAIESGEDIHRAMAATMLNKAFDAVTKEERQNCKRLTFLILYGGGANTLARQLGISKARAVELIREYFAAFRQLDFHINRVKALVKRDLLVTSMFGYKRRFQAPSNWMAWEGWRIERQAWNFLVQNSAACCAFVAMVDLEREMRAKRLRSRIILQVHDSIAVDTHPEEIEDVAKMMRQALEHPNTEAYGVTLTVPMGADIEYGPNWGDKKPLVF
jgi:DNA polymerase-1